ncbi:OpgC domain-containing protein [Aureimonas populi]|nr:OpgC domain-containing protein [Aureimonas populi]
MLSIAINHVAVIPNRLEFDGWQVPTLTLYGYSSAAEIFVFLSGYMVGLVYLSKENPEKLLLRRAGTLYAVNVAAFISSWMIIAVLSPEIRDASGFAFFMESPVSGFALFAVLLVQPLFTDVLALYTALLLLTALLVSPLRMHPARVILASLAIYGAVYVAGAMGLTLNVPGGLPEDDWLWTFNPFTWQFLFIGAVVLGRYRFLSVLFEFLERNRTFALAIVIILAASIGLFLAIQALGIYYVPLSGKTNLGPVRLAHAALVILALMSLLTLIDRRAQEWLGWLSLIGRHTLPCYAFSIPLTYALAGLWFSLGRTQTAYLLCALMVVLAMLAVATVMERRKQRSL